MTPCERCKKTQASCYVTDIDASGKRIERRLCEPCAIQEGWLSPVKVVDQNQILEELIEAGATPEVSESLNLVCEECGTSFREFRNHGLLGCPNDYKVFGETLALLLSRAHDGATHHTGKTPRSLGQSRTTQQELRKLRRQLDEAIAGEDYERAAKLRDRIRELDGA